MKLTDNLELLEELKNHKRDKEILRYHYLQIRLNKSLETYLTELDKNIEYLQNHSNNKLLRNLFK